MSAARIFIWGDAPSGAPPTRDALLAQFSEFGAIAELRYVPPGTRRFRACVLYDDASAAALACASSTADIIVQLSPRPPASASSKSRKKGKGKRVARIEKVPLAATRVVRRRKHLDDDGVGTLAAALPPSVTSLNLAENAFGSAGCGHLAAWHASSGASLVSLNLANNAVGDAGVVAIARACSASLADLNLQRNGVTDAACAALAALPHLSKLSLRGNALVSDAGAAALSRSAALTSLNLGSTALTLDGVAHLVAFTAASAGTLIDLAVAPRVALPRGARRVLVRNLVAARTTSAGTCALAAAAPPLGDEGAQCVAALLGTVVSILLWTVTFHANLAHSLTRSP
jgi:hypothetical protein